MPIYRDMIFPWCIEKLMSGDDFSQIRHRVLENTRGKILEIGFGTGLNIPHYPQTIESLTTIDISSAMNRRAQQRIANANFPITTHVLNGESMPMADHTFDYVVSTWTMCSIDRLGLALGEIRRVLKIDGRLVFVEHGLSPDPRVRTWQHRLTPLQTLIGCGCRLNRDISDILRSSEFKIQDLTRYYMPNAPKTHAAMFEGIALPG